MVMLAKVREAFSEIESTFRKRVKRLTASTLHTVSARNWFYQEPYIAPKQRDCSLSARLMMRCELEVRRRRLSSIALVAGL